ncbi:MAG: hypothetical protein ABI216_22170 [Devosia sp.]
MPILLRQRGYNQPQYPAPIDEAGLGKGIQLLLSPGARTVDYATKRVWVPGGNTSIKTGRGGKVFSFDGVDDDLHYTGYPEIKGTVGTFFIWCPVVGPKDDWGHGLFTETATYYLAHQFGSFYHLGSESSIPIFWFNTTNQSLVCSSSGTTGAGLKVYQRGVDTGMTFSANPIPWSSGSKSLAIGRYAGGNVHDFNGTVRIVGYTKAVWGLAEAKAFHSNPWQIFKISPRKLWVVSAPTGVTGTVASTNANDIAAAVALINLTAASATTNANDTAAANGAATATATSATTNSNDTSAAIATPGFTATSNTANADDIAAATATADAATGATGTVDYTNVNDTVDASAAPHLSGTVAASNIDDVAAASALVGGDVTGAVAYTNLDDTADIAGGMTVVGTSATANANDTATISGTTTLAGSIAYTNVNDIGAAVGVAEQSIATGAVAYTNINDYSSAVGAITFRGSAAAFNIDDLAASFATVNSGIIVEASLTGQPATTLTMKKPGIPTGTADWLKTTIEIILGRRGNKIDIPLAQNLTFSATPTQAECQALYSYTNDVRDSLEQIITRLDG